MTIRDLLLREIEDTPEYILEEILSILRHYKERYQQAKTVKVISEGEESIVPLEELFDNEILKASFLQQSLSKVTKVQQELQEALVAGGYETREQIVELVQEVKRETALGKDWLLPQEDEAWKHL